MFRSAFRRTRCIVPASGGKQPYFISAANGEVLSIAGLWDEWRDPETTEAVLSCTVIVTGAICLPNRRRNMN
jgi:putative SOS response-associated peptidase YedK